LKLYGPPTEGAEARVRREAVHVRERLPVCGAAKLRQVPLIRELNQAVPHLRPRSRPRGVAHAELGDAAVTSWV
jgi:hypothetical protein